MIAIELFEDGDHNKPDAKLTAEIVARARDKGLILLLLRPASQRAAHPCTAHH
ncbi:hypothetical protein ACVXHB_12320 [Escherichia coli]